MSRVEFYTHKGKSILLIDFSRLTIDEIPSVITEARRVIDQQPKQSLLTLTDLTKMHFDAEVMNALKEYAKRNKPYVKAAAVVGMEGLLVVLVQGVERSSVRAFQDFKSREEAQEWLCQQ